MIAVVQRVESASVDVAGIGVTGSIDTGLCVLLAVETGDTPEQARWTAGKIARLRIFSDDDGRFNHSISDVSGAVLLVSQFTLAGDCSRGNRPSFVGAAPPSEARELYELVGRLLEEEHGLPVQTGRFQESMTVSLANHGPATIILRTPEH